MGTAQITSTGRSTATLTYTTTIPASKYPMSYTYAVMFIKGSSELSAMATSGSVWQSGQPVTLNWNASINISSLTKCNLCEFDSGITYQIGFRYNPPGTTGVINQTINIVESGSVTISGPVPCSDCEDNGEKPDEDAEDAAAPAPAPSPYGPPGASDPTISPPAPTSDPCLPPQPTPSSPPMPTPCGGGSGTGPASFSR